jgi:hypothetical protein
MHWTTTARTHRWSRSWRTLALSLPLPWARTLENRLPANRQSRTRACGCAWRRRTRWCWRRSRVDRTRSRLRNNHAARRSSTLRCTSRPSRTVLCRSLRCRPLRGGSCYWRLRRLGYFCLDFNMCSGDRSWRLYLSGWRLVRRRLRCRTLRRSYGLLHLRRWNDHGSRRTLCRNACWRHKSWLRLGCRRLSSRSCRLRDH